MASFWYQNGLAKCLDGTIDLDTDNIDVLLLDDTGAAAASKDHDLLTDLTANELSATNYARKDATVTLQANDTDDRVDVAIADMTWTELGGASNDTVGGAVVFYNSGADAGSIPIAFLDVTDTPTNGSDVTLDFTALASGGNMRIAT